MSLHIYGEITSEKFENNLTKVRIWLQYLVLVRNPKINEVLWLVKFLDNDDEYFKSKFNNFLIMESVPSKDAYHKIVHIVRNLYLDEVDIK